MTRRAPSRPRRDAEPKPVPADWAGRSLVVLRGGRRDGAWFFAEDFARGPDATDPRAVAYGYQPTSDVELHPVYPIMGRVWRYTGS